MLLATAAGIMPGPDTGRATTGVPATMVALATAIRVTATPATATAALSAWPSRTVLTMYMGPATTRGAAITSGNPGTGLCATAEEFGFTATTCSEVRPTLAESAKRRQTPFQAVSESDSLAAQPPMMCGTEGWRCLRATRLEPEDVEVEFVAFGRICHQDFRCLDVMPFRLHFTRVRPTSTENVLN